MASRRGWHLLRRDEDGRTFRHVLFAADYEHEKARRLTPEHPIEQVGARLRAMMPWIQNKKLVDKTKN